MKRLENCERSIKEGPKIDWTVVLANVLYSTRFYVAVASVATCAKGGHDESTL